MQAMVRDKLKLVLNRVPPQSIVRWKACLQDQSLFADGFLLYKNLSLDGVSSVCSPAGCSNLGHNDASATLGAEGHYTLPRCLFSCGFQGAILAPLQVP